jgi:hypothetical protein
MDLAKIIKYTLRYGFDIIRIATSVPVRSIAEQIILYQYSKNIPFNMLISSLSGLLQYVLVEQGLENENENQITLIDTAGVIATPLMYKIYSGVIPWNVTLVNMIVYLIMLDYNKEGTVGYELSDMVLKVLLKFL